MPIMFHMEHTEQATSLAAARDAAGFTQEDLAEKLNITRAAISQWETGDTTPSGPSRMLLALTFDIPVAVVDSWFAKVEAVA